MEQITIVTIELKYQQQVKTCDIKATNVSVCALMEWVRKGVRLLYDQMREEFCNGNQEECENPMDCNISWLYPSNQM